MEAPVNPAGVRPSFTDMRLILVRTSTRSLSALCLRLVQTGLRAEGVEEGPATQPGLSGLPHRGLSPGLPKKAKL